MPKGRIEHANLTVSDPERSAALLQQLCGWHERCPCLGGEPLSRGLAA